MSADTTPQTTHRPEPPRSARLPDELDGAFPDEQSPEDRATVITRLIFEIYETVAWVPSSTAARNDELASLVELANAALGHAFRMSTLEHSGDVQRG